MELIDKSALVAEIKRRMDENRGKQTLPQYFGMIEEDLNILSFIDTLEVKEVDLDKYYHDFLEKEWFGNSHVRTVSEMMAFTAKHFFELGMQFSSRVELERKSYVKIDRKVLFELCDAILGHYGYSDINDCPESDAACFWDKWDDNFRKKVENIRNNS